MENEVIPFWVDEFPEGRQKYFDKVDFLESVSVHINYANSIYRITAYKC